MARINLSVPDALKSQMDELEGRANWSALATETFEREVRKLTKVENMETTQIIERLRASYEDERESVIEQGHSQGTEWAAQYAEYAELVWLAESYDAANELFWWNFAEGPFSIYAQSEFWEHAIGEERTPSEDFVQGFVAGAKELFERVRVDIERRH